MEDIFENSVLFGCRMPKINAMKPWRNLHVMPHVTGAIIRIMAEEYSMDSVIRGHHLCKTI